MHMQGEPKTMQQMPRYDDILIEVEGFLRGRVQAALAAGIDRRRIVLDPGYGFGKTPEQNYRLLRKLRDVDSGRSEERRVGKECVSRCRYRWWPYHEKKKKKQ